MSCRAAAEEARAWRFEEGRAGEPAGALVCAGKGSFSGRGAAPVFDASVPAAKLWDGRTFAPVEPDNARALRLAVPDGPAGGAPYGGEVVVPGSERFASPASFTVEAFVKVARKTGRHALVASKRRNGQNGASWSLSLLPSGALGARFDTQPGAANRGDGFNQCWGSGTALDDGAWHHVALTYDAATREASLYADYVKVGGGALRGALIYDASDLVLGRGLDGWFDEVRLTDAPLHPEQFLRAARFFSDLKPRVASVALLDQTPTRVQSAVKPGLKRIGTLSPKRADEIATPMWSLGCETLDRDLASWDAYKEYVVPLGITRIRLQGGWNRTEKKRGEYDFAWLDAIVDDAHARGLKVCLETSYNNHLYEPGGATGPGGLLPAGEATLAAWDRWVEAMVRHYAPKGVREWMTYNEPNLRKENTPELIVANNIRTASIIKRVDPQAKVGAFVLAGLDVELMRTMLGMIKQQGQLGLFDWAVYHGYSANPDRLNARMAEFVAMLAEVAPNIRPWQGEAGCASEAVQYALSGIDWTEYSHAKWNARRMLCDVGGGVESSVFTISDVSYSKDFISRYGLLKTNPDNSIIKVKTAYYAVQNVVSVFNGSLERVPGYALTVAGDAATVTWFAFRDRRSGLDAVAIWNGAEIPSNDSEVETVDVAVSGGHFESPVWVDLITGDVYEFPSAQVVAEGGRTVFKGVPVYDGPAALTDRSLLSFVPAREAKATAAPKAKGKRAAPKGGGETLFTPRLLAGTQQPAPAVLVCAAPAEAEALATWLNTQAVHAFVLKAGASAEQALLRVRAHAAEWQVKPDAVGVLGVGEAGVRAAAAGVPGADYVIFLNVPRETALAAVPEAKKDKAFVGARGACEPALAAWLEARKGRVF